MRIIPYGRHAELVEYDSLDEVIAVTTQLRAANLPSVDDVVPGMGTVLVRYARRPPNLDELLQPVMDRPMLAESPVDIEVRYDGEDLDHVADACGLSVDAVITLHSSAGYIAAFCGFAPGFAYLTGLPGELELPRRANPRPSVPAGSVAIAAGFTAVYPRASPGGWHLLGHTDAVLFDVARDPPALVPAGTPVRFRRA